MSFFERWFGNKGEAIVQPDIRFGRYSDSYKSTDCYDAWDTALVNFEDGKYLASYEQFLYFLRDEEEENVVWEKTEQGLAFELFQGSKRVVGWATRQRLRVEARVARISAPRPELLRRLVEQNYSLKFSRYALDPDYHITVVFDTHTVDASPYKLYYALKEVATQADKQDDLLLEEFGHMEPVDSSHLNPLSEEETSIKHQYILQQIRETLDEAENGALDREEYPSGTACLLLSLIYKLDYLTKPEGFTMEALERIHRQFFAKENAMNVQQKNEMIIDELRILLERTEKEYSREMYQVKTTFGITAPVTHDRIVNLIDAELHQMDWYRENGYYKIAAAYPYYIVGYGLFIYAVPQPDREFFHLFFRVTEPAYFRTLGFQPDYCDPDTKQLDSKAIRKAIDQITKKHRSRYPQLRPSVSMLSFDNLLDFSRTFLLMIRELDLTRLD